MNEYEAATLATRHAGLWIAAAQVGVGLLQAGIVWYGIRAMQRMGATRAREQDQRHEETMTKADQRHAEAMRRLDAAHDADDKRHAEAMQALEVLIERTAPGTRA